MNEVCLLGPPNYFGKTCAFSKAIQMHRKCTWLLMYFFFSGQKGENKFEGLVLNSTSLELGNSFKRSHI